MTDIEVKSRSRSIKSFSSNELTPDSSVQELINELSSDNHISEHRLRLTKLENGKQVALIPHKTFAENGIPKTASKIELFVKDLGPQISWRTVFWLNTLVPLFFIRYFTMSNHSMVLDLSNTHKLKNLPLQLSFCIFKA